MDGPPQSDQGLALAIRERVAELCAGWRRIGHRLGRGTAIRHLLRLFHARHGRLGGPIRLHRQRHGGKPAAGLCEEAGAREILLSPRAYGAVEERIPAEPAGELTLKGLSAPVEVIRVIQSDGAGLIWNQT